MREGRKQEKQTDKKMPLKVEQNSTFLHPMIYEDSGTGPKESECPEAGTGFYILNKAFSCTKVCNQISVLNVCMHNNIFLLFPERRLREGRWQRKRRCHPGHETSWWFECRWNVGVLYAAGAGRTGAAEVTEGQEEGSVEVTSMHTGGIVLVR